MFVAKYKGDFGFIKPWTAVRDSLTFSQQFLTPAIVEGIRQKLEVKDILRHKLTYAGMSRQQEQIQTRGWRILRREGKMIRDKSILTRGILLFPCLYLAFLSRGDAIKASEQHICLCRNEDVMLPVEQIIEMSDEEFNQLDGFELIFGAGENSFLVGYNRFDGNKPMFGHLEITGAPIRNKSI